ncbi:anti-sigma-I factor RsgI2-like isoform X2 [Lytechinus variegatus]|uniref:anti-sigma-I factor RsgI2-like isoform X2 n=1 Tax=Lytechinus variegatus TaxID=7654 RepID=UPI001BB0E282|nr:anti-sigma-I factor RsgI2-like isoform X2 [Lytechinus variegatus]
MEKSLCNINVGNEVYFLSTSIPPASRNQDFSIGVTLIEGSSLKAWTGTFGDTKENAKRIDLDEQELIDLTRKGLTRQNMGAINFEYQIISLKNNVELSWKKVVSSVKFQIGKVMLQAVSSPPEAIKDILLHSIQTITELKDSIYRLESEKDRISNERTQALKPLEIKPEPAPSPSPSPVPVLTSVPVLSTMPDLSTVQGPRTVPGLTIVRNLSTAPGLSAVPGQSTVPGPSTVPVLSTVPDLSSFPGPSTVPGPSSVPGLRTAPRLSTAPSPSTAPKKLIQRHSNRMAWKTEADLHLVREVVLTQPFQHRAKTKDRGNAWEEVARAMRIRGHKVDKRAVRDRTKWMMERQREKSMKEKMEGWIEVEETEEERTIRQSVETFIQLEEERERLSKDMEEEQVPAQTMDTSELWEMVSSNPHDERRTHDEATEVSTTSTQRTTNKRGKYNVMPKRLKKKPWRKEENWQREEEITRRQEERRKDRRFEILQEQQMHQQQQFQKQQQRLQQQFQMQQQQYQEQQQLMQQQLLQQQQIMQQQVNQNQTLMMAVLNPSNQRGRRKPTAQ